MEVRKGFKQTDIGVIPEDWDVQPLGKLSEKIMVGIASAATHAYRSNGVPLLRNQNIKKNYLQDDDLLFVDEEYETIYKNKRLKTGDLLTARTGYPGTTCIIPPKYDGAQCFTTLITRLKKNGTDANYLCQYINSEYGLVFIEKSKIGGGQKNIGVGIFQAMPIPIPPLSEQQAIAAALSDVDDLLNSLDALIAKKRLIKQGAMQELLTGKKRLPGFGGEWEEMQLGDVLNYERPDRYIVKNTEYLDSGTPVLTANKSFVLGYTDEDFGIYNQAPVIIFDDFTTDKKYVDFPFKVKSSAIKILKPKNTKVNLRFIYERMQLINFSLGDHKRYYISEYQYIKIPVPEFPEQTAIAEILSDMDAEISALEQKREKTRLLKQGMMQELLTGRIRLI